MLIFLSATAPTRFYPLSLHDALPIFRSGAWLAERLPLRLTDAVANLGGRIAFRLAKPPRREIVARNMARVAGGPGASDGEGLVEGAYLSYARYWLETFRLGRYSRQDLLDMVDGANVEMLEEADGAR